MSYKILGYGSLGITLLIIGMKILSLAKLEGMIILLIGTGCLVTVIYLGYKYELERSKLIVMNKNLSTNLQIIEKKLKRYEK